jgi:hypothetical protein
MASRARAIRSSTPLGCGFGRFVAVLDDFRGAALVAARVPDFRVFFVMIEIRSD